METRKSRARGVRTWARRRGAVPWAAAVAGVALVAGAQQPAVEEPGPLAAVEADGAAANVGPFAAGGEDPNAGGAANADFDSLIDLITSTVDPETWLENGTGEGDIQPFITGVYADASGALVLGRVSGGELAALRSRGEIARRPVARRDAQPNSEGSVAAGGRWRQSSKLRLVSLPKLEAAIARRQGEHQPLTPEMLTLAGLERVAYVFVYPETGDLVLAGPAGECRPAPGGRLLSTATRQPVVRLDDLLSLMRRFQSEQGAPFGCAIIPRQESLAAAQQYLAASASEPIEPQQRNQWIEGLRASIGVQDVEYYGLDADSRLARVLLEADYHMKLVGMGLAKGVPGVYSYLATVRLGPGGAAPPMAVLRWWFSLPRSVVAASAEGDSFALPEQCVEVLSENELLAQRGERVHTGASEPLNARFAQSFTAQYAALSAKYPIYGELSRLFELSLALAVIEKEQLAARAGWSPNQFLDAERLRLPSTPAPRKVETVVNHRVIQGRQIIVGVSGGVWADGRKQLQIKPTDATKAGSALAMRASGKRPSDAPDEVQREVRWWWDAD